VTRYYKFAVAESAGPKPLLFCATFDDFDLDCHTGYGETPEDAIIDLLQMHGEHLVRYNR
jgi:hypothetical protein